MALDNAIVIQVQVVGENRTIPIYIETKGNAVRLTAVDGLRAWSFGLTPPQLTQFKEALELATSGDWLDRRS